MRKREREREKGERERERVFVVVVGERRRNCNLYPGAAAGLPPDRPPVRVRNSSSPLQHAESERPRGPAAPRGGPTEKQGSNEATV